MPYLLVTKDFLIQPEYEKKTPSLVKLEYDTNLNNT